MALFSTTMTWRLPALQKRFLSHSITSFGGIQRLFESAELPKKGNPFLFAAVPLFLLSSAHYSSSEDSPILPISTAVTATERSVDASDSFASRNSGAIVLGTSPVDDVNFLLAYFGPSLRKLLTSVEELLTGGLLIPQKAPPVYGEPLGGNDSLSSEITSFAVQERSLLFTESFFVHGIDGPYCKVKRIKGLLRFLFPRTNKLRFYVGREHVATLESTPHSHVYDVFRGKTDEKIGQIEKSKDKCVFYYCPESTTNSVKTTIEPQPIYTLEGDFISRRFVMKNGKDECVAKIKKQLIAFPSFDHYVVRIAPGMDPILALACTCVIDEELDEALQEKTKNAIKRDVAAIGSLGKKILSFLNPF